MSRGVVLLLVVCVVAALTTTSAQEFQPPNTVIQQTPGLLERIMQDWRGMLRSFMGNIMNYISPSTKEPKDGFASGYRRRAEAGHYKSLKLYLSSQEESRSSEEEAEPSGNEPNYGRSDSASGDSSAGSSSSPSQPPIHTHLGEGQEENASHLDSESPSTFAPHHNNKEISASPGTEEEEARLFFAPAFRWGPTFNPNVTPILAAHSWDFLGYLLLFTLTSFIWPIYSQPKTDMDMMGMDGSMNMMGMDGSMNMMGMAGSMNTMGMAGSMATAEVSFMPGVDTQDGMTDTRFTGIRDTGFEQPQGAVFPNPQQSFTNFQIN
ncbi:uncharacterized protein LOC121876601 isoform X2 [Homarus americanus]|uniref:uncharacterized protein LOC121876601 isoform X2 n=1 Tax=Homarus americanus TaxID=6706 RepID=UPI001C462997|nr:uncharacterized protein LOC121876601 isoform X2 [Homarus americanus]